MADNVLKLKTVVPPNQMDLFGHYTGSVSKFASFDVGRGDQERLLRLVDALQCKILVDTRSLCYFSRPQYDVEELAQEFRVRDIFYFRAGTRSDRVASYTDFFTTLRSAIASREAQNVVVLCDQSSINTWMHRAIIGMLSERGRFIPYFSAF